MLQIGEAQQRVLEEIPVLGVERIHIMEALGRVLAQDVAAVRNVPSADNSAMDGYGVIHEDLVDANSSNPKRIKVIGESPAGRPFTGSISRGEAVKIFTGGTIPDGVDTVIMLEDTQKDGDHILCLNDPGLGSHIRPEGEDVKLGERVLHAGDIVRPPEIGMLATLGHAYVYVYQRPIVAILSTGDELVEIGRASCRERV